MEDHDDEQITDARKLPEREQEVVGELSDVFKGAREIVGPLPAGRVLERVEGKGVVLELVEVSEADAAARANRTGPYADRYPERVAKKEGTR